MVLAVVDRYLDVFDRVTGNEARGEHFAHALFHGRDQVERNGAALDFIGKDKAFAAR